MKLSLLLCNSSGIGHCLTVLDALLTGCQQMAEPASNYAVGGGLKMLALTSLAFPPCVALILSCTPADFA